jgi:hypothetical protein
VSEDDVRSFHSAFPGRVRSPRRRPGVIAVWPERIFFFIFFFVFFFFYFFIFLFFFFYFFFFIFFVFFFFFFFFFFFVRARSARSKWTSTQPSLA